VASTFDPAAPAARRAAHDAELARALVAREPAALAALYDRYSSALFGLCRRILGDHAEAEEVLADVFWELWQRPERYDAARGTLWAFLLVLARSRAIDRRRVRRAGGADDAVRLDDAAPGRGPVADPASSPFAHALLAEQRARIERALAGLAAEQRRAIELSFYDGLSHGEISAALGQPLGTVKGRIRQGLLRLRDALRGIDDEAIP
jgi:RNA polymerase sigma-70 factor (ECF subfamily)